MMDIDFSFIDSRKRKTDYDALCPHEPECEIYESSGGPVNVCNLGDMHLRNAYVKMLRDGADYDARALKDEILKRGFTVNE